MLCKACDKPVLCPEHGDAEITEYEHDMDESWFYSCGLCVVKYRTAFGSIVHWCEELFLRVEEAP